MLKNINRYFLEPLHPDEINSLVDKVVKQVISAVDPIEIVLFGSAVNGKFDSMSDLDFVVIVPKEKLIWAERKLYSFQPLEDRSVDFLCTDPKTYQKKSELGGVYFIASKEGKVVYSKPS